MSQRCDRQIKPPQFGTEQGPVTLRMRRAEGFALGEVAQNAAEEDLRQNQDSLRRWAMTSLDCLSLGPKEAWKPSTAYRMSALCGDCAKGLRKHRQHRDTLQKVRGCGSGSTGALRPGRVVLDSAMAPARITAMLAGGRFLASLIFWGYFISKSILFIIFSFYNFFPFYRIDWGDTG